MERRRRADGRVSGAERPRRRTGGALQSSFVTASHPRRRPCFVASRAVVVRGARPTPIITAQHRLGPSCQQQQHRRSANHRHKTQANSPSLITQTSYPRTRRLMNKSSCSFVVGYYHRDSYCAHTIQVKHRCITQTQFSPYENSK